MSAEMRSQPRLRVFLKGRIIFNNSQSSIDCLIRDMSAEGARLMLSETATLPEKFDLFIPQKDKTHRATLRWRREDGVGVTFDKAETDLRDSTVDPTMNALLRRVGELEAENAALRRHIAELHGAGAAAPAL